MQVERIDTINNIEKGAVFTAEDFGSKRAIIKENIHPYVGYVIDGKLRAEGCESAVPADCYSRVKVPTDFDLPKRSNDRLIVGILGGSVAAATNGGSIKSTLYERTFKKLAEYKDREIIVFTMAAGGYKQPQQLMNLNYYLTLGAEFDILVNIDGFNEAAIPVFEYQRAEVHPVYPRSWEFRVAESVSPELIELIATKKNLEGKHVARATLMSNPWFRNSPLSNLLWKMKHNRYLTKISEASAAVENTDVTGSVPRDFKYEQLGPDYEFTSWVDLHQDAVDIWARSSSLINDLAESNGARYFHFLQPNQYIDGAKPMSDDERELAIVESGGYGNTYKDIYPLMKKKEPWLLDQGVKFNDLTFLYQETTNVIYVDNCCHVNTEGSRMIIEAVVDAVRLDNLKNQK